MHGSVCIGPAPAYMYLMLVGFRTIASESYDIAAGGGGTGSIAIHDDVVELGAIF